jgi:hypothetical protein
MPDARGGTKRSARGLRPRRQSGALRGPPPLGRAPGPPQVRCGRRAPVLDRAMPPRRRPRPTHIGAGNAPAWPGFWTRQAASSRRLTKDVAARSQGRHQSQRALIAGDERAHHRPPRSDVAQPLGSQPLLAAGPARRVPRISSAAARRRHWLACPRTSRPARPGLRTLHVTPHRIAQQAHLLGHRADRYPVHQHPASNPAGLECPDQSWPGRQAAVAAEGGGGTADHCLRPARDALSASLRDSFHELGLPARMRTDNGTPFASCGSAGLSVWRFGSSAAGLCLRPARDALPASLGDGFPRAPRWTPKAGQSRTPDMRPDAKREYWENTSSDRVLSM